jgi:hypothetical protein
MSAGAAEEIAALTAIRSWLIAGFSTLEAEPRPKV